MLTARPTIYRGIQMRSRLEANVARWLDTHPSFLVALGWAPIAGSERRTWAGAACQRDSAGIKGYMSNRPPLRTEASQITDTRDLALRFGIGRRDLREDAR
jgi:hypothetical protein